LRCRGPRETSLEVGAFLPCHTRHCHVIRRSAFVKIRRTSPGEFAEVWPFLCYHVHMSMQLCVTLVLMYSVLLQLALLYPMLRNDQMRMSVVGKDGVCMRTLTFFSLSGEIKSRAVKSHQFHSPRFNVNSPTQPFVSLQLQERHVAFYRLDGSISSCYVCDCYPSPSRKPMLSPMPKVRPIAFPGSHILNQFVGYAMQLELIDHNLVGFLARSLWLG
jgi:hypothetical protein